MKKLLWIVVIYLSMFNIANANIFNCIIDDYDLPGNKVDIDIVIEGGCFNGLYSLGALLLIKELEKRKYFKVHRISGASIGTIMGFAYISDSLLDVPNYFKKIRKNTINLVVWSFYHRSFVRY